MEDLLVFANLVGFAVTIMIIWFKTNAFVEYCNVLNLKFLLFGYQSNTNLTFPQYLYVKSQTLFKSTIFQFLAALISCPLCLGFWLSVVVASLYGAVLLTPVFYISILVSYFLTIRIIG